MCGERSERSEKNTIHAKGVATEEEEEEKEGRFGAEAGAWRVAARSSLAQGTNTKTSL